MPWGFEEQQRTVLVQVFCTEAWAEKKGYYMEISLILNDLTIDYSQSRTHDPILDAQHIDKTFQKSTGGCRVSTRGFYEITKKLMGHSASAVCCFVCCFGGTTSLHNKSSRLLLHGNKNWECSDLHRLFFWLHVPHFCLLGRKKDFKSDDFLFFFKHIIRATTVTYSNLEFIFLHVMTRVVSGIPGRKVSFGSMLFYESDLLGAQPEWTWQYKIHASSRLSCKSVKRVPSVFVGKIITDRHRFGLHEDDHFQYPPKV